MTFFFEEKQIKKGQFKFLLDPQVQKSSTFSTL